MCQKRKLSLGKGKLLCHGVCNEVKTHQGLLDQCSACCFTIWQGRECSGERHRYTSTELRASSPSAPNTNGTATLNHCC